MIDPLKKIKNKKILANIDAIGHVTGRSTYVDDIPTMQGTLFIKIFDSPVAHGKIKSIDFSEAEQLPGVVKIFSQKDIPGENEIRSEDGPSVVGKVDKHRTYADIVKGSK